MWYQALIIFGSGLASAVLFLLPAKGSLAALLFGVLAPLPLMIAALGFGVRSAILAVLAAFILIAAILHPNLGAAFLLSVALPALLLGWQSQRTASPFWSGPAGLLVSIVALAAGIDLLGLGVLALRYQSYDAAIADFAGQFAPIVAHVFGNDTPGAFSEIEIARLIVIAMAPVAAGWGVIGLAFNFWLSGRITQISGRLSRPWPDIAANLALPWTALGIFVVSLIAALMLADLPRIIATTISAALATGFALHGLAIIHALTRTVAARVGLLAALYAVIVLLFPWPLLMTAGIGMLDCLYPLRRKQTARGLPPSTSQN